MDTSKLKKIGVEPEISLDEGIIMMIEEYRKKYMNQDLELRN